MIRRVSTGCIRHRFSGAAVYGLRFIVCCLHSAPVYQTDVLHLSYPQQHPCCLLRRRRQTTRFHRQVQSSTWSSDLECFSALTHLLARKKPDKIEHLQRRLISGLLLSEQQMLVVQRRQVIQ